MDEALASKLIAAAFALDEQLGVLDNVISAVQDEQERSLLARKLGDIIGAVNDGFIVPITKSYPHLNPEI